MNKIAPHTAPQFVPQTLRFSLLLGLLAILPNPLFAKVERERVRFDFVEQLAQEAAKEPYSPDTSGESLPAILRDLTYDQYRNIRYRSGKEFWRDDELPFGMALFHPGYLFKSQVVIHEFTADYCQSIRFSRDLFDYTGSGVDGALPASLGYAGFRINNPMNRPDIYDEVAVFQGASYYRMLGQNQAYGMSSRGLALNAGLDGVSEEFPTFTHFWVGRPQPGAASLTVFALLNSQSLTGAYQFVVRPGKDTIVDVRATLFFRESVEHVGVAPLTSMFWFGENTTKPFDDHRPEVHDSDGLVIKSATGECLWRPLRNDPKANRTYTFSADNVRGFGLVQRDRDSRTYQDEEANYHMRPSVWTRPKGDWGEGTIRLVELATSHELSDNIVAAWEPAVPPAPGEPYRIAYSQTWSLDPNPASAGSWVSATRSGRHEWAPDTRLVVLDFTGPMISRLGQDEVPEAIVSIAGDDVILAHPPQVRRYSGSNDWRVMFTIKAVEPGENIQGAEVRCSLKLGNDYLSETWTGWLPL